jgi:pyocin large subunit-like protein
MPRSNGFEDAIARLDHWGDHKGDFGNCTVDEYVAMADTFLTEPRKPSVEECFRKCGDRLRYDRNTGAFGIITKDAIIKTYFRPIPCWGIPNGYPKKIGDCHGHIDNMAYFNFQCKQ